MQFKKLGWAIVILIGLVFAPRAEANDAYLADEGAAIQSVVNPYGPPLIEPLPGIFSNNCGSQQCLFQLRPGFSFTNPFPRVIAVGQTLNIAIFFKIDAAWTPNSSPPQTWWAFSLSGDLGTATNPYPSPIQCQGQTVGGGALDWISNFSTSYLTPGFHTVNITVWQLDISHGCSLGAVGVSRSFQINVMPTNVSLLDPLQGLVSNGAVITNTSLLATGGRPISGVAADGVTEALIRIQTPNVGDQFMVTLLSDQQSPPVQSTSANEDGALGTPGSTSFSQSQVLVTASSPTGSPPGYAFVVYRAPVDFARPTASGFRSGTCNGQTNTDNLLACRSVSIQVQDVTTGGPPSVASILIVRPPVALIHGLWSDWKGWNSFSPLVLGKNQTDSRFSVLRVSYDDNIGSSITSSVPQYSVSLTNARANSLGFANNAPKVIKQISDWMQQFRLGHNPGNSPVAVAQIDVVGHSMGGVISRTLPLTTGYFADPNFNQGLIHKLITIDSPHLGSPLAAQLLGSNSDCIRELLAGEGSFSFSSVTMNNVTGPVTGAVGDMQGNGVAVDSSLSPALNAIAQPGTHALPTALAAGVYTNFASLDCTLCRAQYIRYKCGKQQGDPLAQKLTSTAWPLIFGPAGNNTNDAIVGQTSQLNGLTSNFVHSGLVHSPGIENLDFTGPSVLDASSAPNPIATDVITLLNTPVTQQSMFNNVNP